MTSEQIAELRKLAIFDVVNQETSEVEDRRDWLMRLLDEREALLEALTGLEVWITKNVSADFTTGDQPPQRVEALAVARRVLDKVCSP